ncbi:VOC family protein [Sphingomonas sp. IC-11]|uniref:VOC family protein n=1 Tax=Sphingomonas sp. IC-11 TaxID=2898528 RepID=UPI001E424B1F|nr:VOC family protein [Sphingomonas sp. IC-11]MCD2316837.1 VOC family protein [Sphingomonas sp. IC-11]
MPVLGMGGLFFRARDPEALGAWYRDHLNVGPGCSGDPAALASEWFWQARGGPFVFAPFKDTTDYFPADRAFMINLRVSGLAEMIRDLGASGIAVETRAEWGSPETGSFARLQDPEGNVIELWEPPA